MENKPDAWRLLLNSVSEKDNQIWDMRKKEIEILQLLMDKDKEIESLIHIIAEMTYTKSEVNKNGK